VTGLFTPGTTHISGTISHGLPGTPHISLMLIQPTAPLGANPNNPSAPGGLNFALTPFLLDTSGGSFRVAATMLATRFGDGQSQMTVNFRWSVVTK
jgi:hypothetical protein